MSGQLLLKVVADSARVARDLLRGKGYTVENVTEQRDKRTSF